MAGLGNNRMDRNDNRNKIIKPSASQVLNDQEIDLDAVLLEMGEFGRYQRFVYGYLGLAILVTAVYNCQYVFNAGEVRYRCRVPECESTPQTFKTDGWGKFALPASGSDCNRLVPIGKTCEPASFTNKTQPCTSLVYESSQSIVPEYNLGCHEWKRTLVGTTHAIGVLFAIPATAAVSDAFGRRLALIGTAVLPAFFGVARAFCNNYYLYLVLEFLEALVGNGTYSTAFIMALEIVGLNKRVLGGYLLHGMYAIGQMTAGGVAWAVPYWRTYTLVIFTPSFLFVVYYAFVEESVRWLLCRKRRVEAVRIILKIAATNKVKLLPNTMRTLTGPPERPPIRPGDKLRKVQERILEEKQKTQPKLFRRVLKSKIIMFRLCVCSFWWVSLTMIYYGLSINSVSLAGNKYFNYIMTALVEIPGGLLGLVSLNRFGRKSSIMTSFFLCGISLLILPAVHDPRGVVALTLVGKMMISLNFCAIYIYTIELFPTQARHALLACCSMTGRIGSITAPQTPLLMRYAKSLPYILFGSLAGASGMTMLLTPETLHMKLPDTIEQAEEMNVATRTRLPTDMIASTRKV